MKIMNSLNKFALVDIGHVNHISVDSLIKINISPDTFYVLPYYIKQASYINLKPVESIYFKGMIKDILRNSGLSQTTHH